MTDSSTEISIYILYVPISARRLSCLGNRTSLGGIALLLLFIYKYVADTSFLLISCVATDDKVSIFDLLENRVVQGELLMKNTLTVKFCM